MSEERMIRIVPPESYARITVIFYGSGWAIPIAIENRLEPAPPKGFTPLCQVLEMCDLCKSKPEKADYEHCPYRKRD